MFGRVVFDVEPPAAIPRFGVGGAAAPDGASELDTDMNRARLLTALTVVATACGGCVAAGPRAARPEEVTTTAMSPSTTTAAVVSVQNDVGATADALHVDTCDTDRMAEGTTVLSTYGSSVITLDTNCEAAVIAMGGPVNTFTWRDDGSGYGIVYGQPRDFDECGVNKLPSQPIRSELPGWPHHELAETPWGTYMVLVAVEQPNGALDDILVEFDRLGVVLGSLSLATLVYGDPGGAIEVDHPDEAWLHTNSIGFLPDGRLLVILRNINEVMIYDWQARTEIKRFGSQYLGWPHHARWDPLTQTITVYDNGVGREETSIAFFDAEGDFLGRRDLGFYAPAYGSVQHLDNGNWLVVDGSAGRVIEYDADWDIVMEVHYLNLDFIPFKRNPDGGFKAESIVYRARKVDRRPLACNRT